MAKLFQYDKKVWEDAETSHTWQFGIVGRRSFLWVNCEVPTCQRWSSGGFHIVISFLSSSLFGMEFNDNRQSFAFHLLTEYFEGWDE